MIWLLILMGLAVGLALVASASGAIRFMEVAKDGGPNSTVTGFWVIEIKRLFSIALLRFNPGSREEFHSHAFHSVSWVLGPGILKEEHLLGHVEYHPRSWRAVLTFRHTFHRVCSTGVTWVLTFRGPWQREWWEYNKESRVLTELAPGRAVTATFYIMP